MSRINADVLGSAQFLKRLFSSRFSTRVIENQYNAIITDSSPRDQICPGTQATHLACSFSVGNILPLEKFESHQGRDVRYHWLGHPNIYKF